VAEKLPGDDSGMISPANHPDDLAAMYAEINAPKEAPPPPKDVPCGGDEVFFVEPIGRWRDDLRQFTVPFEDPRNAFAPVLQLPIFQDACEKAGNYFADRGALWPVRITEDSMEIHLHPYSLDMFGRLTPQVVFLFKKEIAGKKIECGVPYMLSQEQVGFLKATGRWPNGRSVN
jgi:hypothetical protein